MYYESVSHSVVSNSGWFSACNAGVVGSVCGLGRSPGEGNSYPLQYSCLKNPEDRGAWRATVHGVTKSQTWLRGFHFKSLLYSIRVVFHFNIKIIPSYTMEKPREKGRNDIYSKNKYLEKYYQKNRDLCSVLCGILDGRGVWGRADTCVCMAVPSLSTWNYGSIVNQLHSNIKEKV